MGSRESKMAVFRSTRREATFDYDLLEPEIVPRREPKLFINTDIEDADYVTIINQPSYGFENDNQGPRPDRSIKPKPYQPSLFQKSISKVERCLAKLSVDGFAALVAGSSVGVFVLAGGLSLLNVSGDDVLKPTNPLGIKYANVTPQSIDGLEVLVISGVLYNAGSDTLNVPEIKADFKDKMGLTVSTLLIQPPVSEMKPGNSHGFSAKVRHVGGKIPDIKLSFDDKGATSP